MNYSQLSEFRLSLARALNALTPDLNENFRVTHQVRDIAVSWLFRDGQHEMNVRTSHHSSSALENAIKEVVLSHIDTIAPTFACAVTEEECQALMKQYGIRFDPCIFGLRITWFQTAIQAQLSEAQSA